MGNERYKDFINKENDVFSFIKYLKINGFDFSVPIDIYKIINFLSIDINDKPDFRKITVTGNISVTNGEPYIWINPMQNSSIERKRFTMAHELGHYILHIAPENKLNEKFSDDKVIYNRDDSWNHVEMEANNFSAQLLMPSNLISEEAETIIRKHKSETQTNIEKHVLIKKLAKIFQVSLPSMEFRLNKLGVKL